MKQIYKSPKSLFEKYLPVRFAVIAIASLSILSFTANAEVVEVWMLDNFFSNVRNGNIIDPDGAVTVTNIAVGDTVTWIHMGAIFHTTFNQILENQGQLFFEGELWQSPRMSPGDSFSHTFPNEGEFPYFCTIHGQHDEEGLIVVPETGQIGLVWILVVIWLLGQCSLRPGWGIASSGCDSAMCDKHAVK